MEFVIDLSGIPTGSPILFGWWFFKTIGWIFPVIFVIWGIADYWQSRLRDKYRKTRKYITLAIDVPKNLEIGPLSVENIFNQLAGAQMGVGRMEKWWTGEIPDSFSFEIVSLGGYIQFIINCCEQYRDLVEAIIYAQYPDAEIMEVEDYTKDYKKIKFPTSKYELWGTELILDKKEFLPIRTYTEFEHNVEGYRDSMAGLLEALTRIGPGEQVWIQFVITPAGNDWAEKGKIEIKKMIGEKVEKKKDFFDKIYDFPMSILSLMGDAVGFGAGEGGGEKKSDLINKVPHLTDGEKLVVKAAGRKISKLGFYTKIRVIYLAEKSMFKSIVPKVIMGGFKQFNTLDMNGFKSDSKTKTGGVVFRKKKRLAERKNKILKSFTNRGHYLEPGIYGNVLNSEELATIYHFPTLNVKAPMLKRSEAKKAEPPMSLPTESGGFISAKKPTSEPAKNNNISSAPIISETSNVTSAKAEPPTNLPIG